MFLIHAILRPDKQDLEEKRTKRNRKERDSECNPNKQKRVNN